MFYTLPKLPYSYDALEPHIDAQTMEIHHTRHHATYVANLNTAIEGHDLGDPTAEELVSSIHTLPDKIRMAVCNQGGGHINHTLFWNVMSKAGGGEPGPDLVRAMDAELGGFERFRESFTKKAMTCFGSGWAWLAVDPDKRLVVEHTSNQDSPLIHGHTPILCIDLWEHAYYLKYQNRRADYVKAFFHVIDWDRVGEYYMEAIRKTHAIHR